MENRRALFCAQRASKGLEPPEIPDECGTQQHGRIAILGAIVL